MHRYFFVVVLVWFFLCCMNFLWSSHAQISIFFWHPKPNACIFPWMCWSALLCALVASPSVCVPGSVLSDPQDGVLLGSTESTNFEETGLNTWFSWTLVIPARAPARLALLEMCERYEKIWDSAGPPSTFLTAGWSQSQDHPAPSRRLAGLRVRASLAAGRWPCPTLWNMAEALHRKLESFAKWSS